MSITNLSISNASYFGTLVSLICQLLGGGHFEIANLFYDSKVIDSKFLSEIRCLDEISWTGIDVNSEILQWSHQKRSDRTIQLIFPNLNAVNNFSNLENGVIYHRLFIFNLDTKTNFGLARILEFGKKEVISTQGSLILIYDCKKDETKVHLFTQVANDEPIHIQNTTKSDERIFEKLFGIFDELWLMGAEAPFGIECLPRETRALIPFMVVNRFFANLYFTKMKMDFVEQIVYKCGKSDVQAARTFVRHIPKSIYNELSNETEQLPNDTV